MLRTPSRWYLCPLALALAGCAELPPPPAAPARDLDAERKLHAVTVEREEVEAKLAVVVLAHREKCEFQVGDCVILVNEQRDDLMNAEELSACNVMPDRAGKTTCMAEQLMKRGKHTELSAFYASDTACMRTVLACTDLLDQNAAEVAVEVRAGERRRALAALPRGAAAGNLAGIDQAKTEYLRSTLPPSRRAACEPGDEAIACTRAATAHKTSFETELLKEDYDPEVALGLFEQFARATSLCRTSEIVCLSKTLETQGLFQEAKLEVVRNFAALERRQELSARASQKSQARCLSGPSNEHQARIVSAYVAYAHEPVLYFRMQLDRAFLAMHEAQVTCLTSQALRPSGQGVVSAK